jgi:hypothetical protein
MISRIRLIGLTLFGVFVLAAVAQSDDQPKDDSAAKDQQIAESKATRKTAAASVNFRKELNLPFQSLSTLGSRIDTARRASDPVALAHTASELAVAEKVSGKQAKITSAAVLKESAELAKLRKQAAELQAVTKVAEQVAAEQNLIQNLKDQMADAQAIAKLDTEAIKKNEEPGWTPRKIVINNYSDEYLTIFVNGFYKTEISPGLSQVVMIEQRINPVVLTAHGNEDIDTWGPRYIWGKFQTYTWNIN